MTMYFFTGCIQDVRIGTHQSSLSRPTVRENVMDGCPSPSECTSHCPSSSDCVSHWGGSTCECRPGYAGEHCSPICEEHSPCSEGGYCILGGKKGYECKCNSTEYSGEYCEVKLDQPCPSGWWGYPVCGPCSCDTHMGYVNYIYYIIFFGRLVVILYYQY